MSRPNSCCLNQAGRGYDPTIVVGNTLSTTFFGMSFFSNVCQLLRPIGLIWASEYTPTNYGRNSREGAPDQAVRRSQRHRGFARRRPRVNEEAVTQCPGFMRNGGG